jgi:hypothetical protein
MRLVTVYARVDDDTLTTVVEPERMLKEKYPLISVSVQDRETVVGLDDETESTGVAGRR